MFAHLVMVTALNNNKFYDMEIVGDRLNVRYGRIGQAGVSASYPASAWNQKYNEKIRKGYKDMTELVEASRTPSAPEFKPVEDNGINELFQFLLNCSRQIVRTNYTVSTDKVTIQMVDSAQRQLILLGQSKNTFEFNELLLELFSILPRNMSRVQNYMAESVSDMGEIIQREQNLLDVMRGQVVIRPSVPAIEGQTADKTILEALGITVSNVTSEEEQNILRHLGQQAGKYHAAWRIDTKATRGNFEDYMSSHPDCKKKFLWHGSKNENWLNILSTGLKLNPNAAITGKMFGHGIYFAPSASKSAGYTSLSGSYWANGHSSRAFMGVMEVACGKAFDVYDHQSRYSSITGKNLSSFCNGANYVFAHKDKGMLRNDELIVYDEAQVTIRYLVELKA